MPVPITFTAYGGRLVQDVQSVTVGNNDVVYVHTEVPANKRWVLINIKAVNPDSVNRAIFIYVYKEVARTNLVVTLVSADIATTDVVNYPNSVAALYNRNNSPGLMILRGGNVLSVHWAAGGASAGGTDADGLVLTYLEYDV